MHKVSIIVRLAKFDALKKALNDLGVTGMTVTQVMGCGIQILETGIVGTPGSVFGASGQGFFRLTAFSTRENTIEAAKRMRTFFKRL